MISKNSATNSDSWSQETIDRLIKENPDDQKLRDECQDSAVDIAKYFLSLDPERKYFTKSKLGNARLNTMLHISQMLWCAKTGKLLFKEPMIAYPPGYQELSTDGLKELDRIMFDKSIKNKKAQISLIYKRENKENLLRE